MSEPRPKCGFRQPDDGFHTIDVHDTTNTIFSQRFPMVNVPFERVWVCVRMVCLDVLSDLRTDGDIVSLLERY